MTEYELEPTIHYTDAEKIKRLTAWHESEKAEIATLRAENARLREDARLADMAWKDNQAALKAQAAQIEAMTTALEDMKILVNNPSAWEHYDDEVSAKIKNLLVIARLAKDETPT